MNLVLWCLVLFVVSFVGAALPGLVYYAVMRLRHPEWWQA